jgi:hypothetical protein
VEDGITVTVTVDTAASVGTVTYPSSTTWSVDITNLAEGDNTITASVTDAVGNTGSAQTVITLDTIPPTLTIDPVTSPTNVDSQTITGAREDGFAVIVSVDTAASLGTVTYPSPATWSVNITGLVEGDNVITALSTDTGGNSTTVNATITLDTVPPAVSIDPVTSPTNVDSQTVTGTVEDGITVTVTVDTAASVGTVTYPSSTTWSVDITGLVEGDNVITATATDGAGNTASAQATITLDTVPPAVGIDPVTSPTNVDSQTVTGTVEDGITVTVTVDTAASVGTVTYPSSTTWSVDITGLVEGDNVITASATDAVGNTGSAQATITLDTSGVLVSIDPVTSPTNADSQTVTGTVSDGDTVSVTADTSASVGTVTYPSSTTWSVDITGLVEGDNVITAEAANGFGVTTTDTATITLDTVPPTVSIDPLTSPTNVDSQTVTGTVEDGLTVTVTVDTAASVGTVTYPSISTWSVDITSLVEGDNVITASATDAAGNTGSGLATITLDTAAPVTTASPGGGLYPPPAVSVTLTCDDGVGSGCDSILYCTGSGCTPDTTYSGSVSVTTTDLRFAATDLAGNAEAVQTETYTVAAAGCVDGPSLQCVDRTGGGSDADNLESGMPSAEVSFDFKLGLQETSGDPFQSAQVFLTQRTSPVTGDFHAFDLTCGPDIATGDICSYTTKLGPAAAHRFYFKVVTANGTEMRHPQTGYLTGPAIQLLTGYNLVGLPRDVDSLTLDGQAAFGSDYTYRWNPSLGYYTMVTSSEPVSGGKGYFAYRQTPTLPEHGGIPDVAASQFAITLETDWNIVTNPYAGNVLLSDVQVQKDADPPVSWTTAVASGWIANALYYYQGDDWGSTYGWTTDTDAILVPWVANWVEVLDDTATYTLIIPRPAQ